MTSRTMQKLIPASPLSEGAGVTIQRTIGTASLRHLDPFLMLDYFGSDNPNDYIAGFPDHPHRGFITVTYMLDGHMLHQDSMGNRGDLRAGGVQWMKAASGVIHSEMPQQEQGLLRGFQLWLNLPVSEKMSAPAYQEFSAERIPSVAANGHRVKVIAGEYQGVRGPVHDPHTEALYLDIELTSQQPLSVMTNSGSNGFIYVFDGSVQLADNAIPAHHLALLGPGEELTISSAGQAGRLILVCGRPIGEPIVQHGPFVMTSRDEIMQAFDDYQRGKLVQTKATMTTA